MPYLDVRTMMLYYSLPVEEQSTKGGENIDADLLSNHRTVHWWEALKPSGVGCYCMWMECCQPSSSKFATTKTEKEGEERLSNEIMEYSTLGEVFLLGDFNAQTCNDWCKEHDMEDLVTLHAIQEEATVRVI